MKTALVAGGSGLVGRVCLQTLLVDPAYANAVSVSRRELPVSHPKLVQKVLSFENLAALDLPPVDDIFCALGTTIRKAGSQPAFRRVDYDYPLALADHALKFGAKQFVLVSSVGADAKSRNFYLRTKGELERALRRLPFKALHIFRPSLLLGKRDEFRVGESIGAIAAKLVQFAMAGPLSPYHPVSAMALGKAMVVAAGSNQEGLFVWTYKDIKRFLSSMSL